jgi:hypothetical protein
MEQNIMPGAVGMHTPADAVSRYDTIGNWRQINQNDSGYHSRSEPFSSTFFGDAFQAGVYEPEDDFNEFIRNPCVELEPERQNVSPGSVNHMGNFQVSRKEVVLGEDHGSGV